MILWIHWIESIVVWYELAPTAHPHHAQGLSRIAKYQERALLNPHKGIGVACASRRNCIETAPYSFPQCIAFLNFNKPYKLISNHPMYRSVIRYRPSYDFEPQLWFPFTARLCKLHRRQKLCSLLTVCIFIRLINHAENKVSCRWLYKIQITNILPTFKWVKETSSNLESSKQNYYLCMGWTRLVN